MAKKCDRIGIGRKGSTTAAAVVVAVGSLRFIQVQATGSSVFNGNSPESDAVTPRPPPLSHS